MPCQHPPTAHITDRARGTVTCAICGEVLNDQQFELDPAFARGERSAVPARSANRIAVSTRPHRSSVTHVTAASQRPSVEVARRKLAVIARQLEISADLAEMATGIYKLAVNVNAVSGARSGVLCACLYAVCRREGTAHMVFDFCDATKDTDPFEILSYLRHICASTNTEAPPLDPSFLLQRFAHQLHLGSLERPICICAVKILRAMRDDWIGYGRQPLGLCAAALIVACNVFGVPRSPDELCGMVRLSGFTIAKRLDEFLATPTAELLDIDSYAPSATTLPPAFSRACLRGGIDDSLDRELRDISALYYELVNEAKESAAPTPERCAKWRAFITKHCELNNVEVLEENCILENFSAKEQLVMLGLPHSEPVEKSTLSQPKGLSQPMTEATSLSGQLLMLQDVLRDRDVETLIDESSFGRSSLGKVSQYQAGLEEGARRPFQSRWQHVELTSVEVDDGDDLEHYVVVDLETRIHRENIAEKVYGEFWSRGAPRDDIRSITDRHPNKRRRREPIREHSTVQESLIQALRGKGAGSVVISQIGLLVPGLMEHADDLRGEVDGVSEMDEWLAE